MFTEGAAKLDDTRQDLTPLLADLPRERTMLLPTMSHSIVSSSVLFVGFQGIQHGLSEVLRWLLLTTVGDLLGGVGLVAPFRLARVREKERQYDQSAL